MATVTIDRPSTRNALALRTIDELRAAVARAEDNPAIRVLVLTGAGDRVFASGADLDEIPDAMDTPEKAAAYDERVAGLYRALLETPVPVVARIQGHAIGGGLLLALACDLRICRAGVKVGLPVSRIGLMLSPLEHKLVVDQIGPSRAKWLLLTGRKARGGGGRCVGSGGYGCGRGRVRRSRGCVDGRYRIGCAVGAGGGQKTHYGRGGRLSR